MTFPKHWGQPRVYRNDPLAREMKALREKRGETQAEFAEHLQIGRTTMTTWETCGIPRHKQIRLFVEMVLKSLPAKRVKPWTRAKIKYRPSGMYAVAVRESKRQKREQAT